MARSLSFAASVAMALAALGVSPLGLRSALAAPPAPPLPAPRASQPTAPAGPTAQAGPTGQASAKPTSPASAEAAAAPATTGDALPAERVRRGIVQVEQNGRPLGVGTVLANDGRVLTALSALGASEQPEVRYADGTVVKTRIGHKDRAWDLALLVPQTGRWLDGLSPTTADPFAGELKAFLPKAGKLGPQPIAAKGRVDARSKEGDPLKALLDVDLKGSPSVVGAPIVDGSGKVAGILVRACKVGPQEEDAGAKSAPAKPAAKSDASPCVPLVVAAPVYALRGFLIKTPAGAVQPAPWLGLGGTPATSGNFRGVRIVAVAPGSPAEKAGLKPGNENPDTVVAVDGQPVETPEQLAEAIAKRGIGQQVKLLVHGGGKLRDVSVTLRGAP